MITALTEPTDNNILKKCIYLSNRANWIWKTYTAYP